MALGMGNWSHFTPFYNHPKGGPTLGPASSRHTPSHMRVRCRVKPQTHIYSGKAFRSGKNMKQHRSSPAIGMLGCPRNASMTSPQNIPNTPASGDAWGSKYPQATHPKVFGRIGAPSIPSSKQKPKHLKFYLNHD